MYVRTVLTVVGEADVHTYSTIPGGRPTHIDPDEQETIRTVIDGILLLVLRYQARKLAS